jgi:hypothetical protein
MTLLRLALFALSLGPILSAAPLLEFSEVFPAKSNGIARHRGPKRGRALWV